MKKLFEKYREIIVYIIVGLATTVIAYGVRFAVLYPVAAAMGLDLGNTEDVKVSLLRAVATSAGWCVGVVFAYFANKVWVFRDKVKGAARLWIQFGKFTLSRLSTYFVELGIGVFVPWLLLICGYQSFKFIIMIDADMIATAISMVVVTVLNYILSKLLVFKRQRAEK